MDILQLPDEMLGEIFCHLSAEDLVATAATCKQFRKIATQDSFWIHHNDSMFQTDSARDCDFFRLFISRMKQIKSYQTRHEFPSWDLPKFSQLLSREKFYQKVPSFISRTSPRFERARRLRDLTHVHLLFLPLACGFLDQPFTTTLGILALWGLAAYLSQKLPLNSGKFSLLFSSCVFPVLLSFVLWSFDSQQIPRFALSIVLHGIVMMVANELYTTRHMTGVLGHIDTLGFPVGLLIISHHIAPDGPIEEAWFSVYEFVIYLISYIMLVLAVIAILAILFSPNSSSHTSSIKISPFSDAELDSVPGTVIFTHIALLAAGIFAGYICLRTRKSSNARMLMMLYGIGLLLILLSGLDEVYRICCVLYAVLLAPIVITVTAIQKKIER